jgi:uncharacterized membrane protein (DUF485 family)
MTLLDHAPAPAPSDDERTVARNARYGNWLFVAYLLFYGGFVVASAFRPEWLDAVPVAGVNLAIVYGFALIIVALALALVYAWACRRPVDPLQPIGHGPEDGA